MSGRTSRAAEPAGGRPAATGRLRGRGVAALVAAMLAAHIVLALLSTRQRTVTVDEIYHVTAGYLYDVFGDFRIHPDNGVLPQRLHGLPAMLQDANPPPMAGSEAWRTSDPSVVSYQFFYESGNDHWPLLLAARSLNLIFSTGICGLVFAWARTLAGTRAGLVALGLAAFSPTLLAHGPLATSDAAAALGLTASAGAFWWQLQAPGWQRILASAVVFGLACLTKFSAVLLIPVFLLLLIAHPWLAATGRDVRRIAASAAAHGLVPLLVIWAFYGFRYAAFAPGVPAGTQFVHQWDSVLAGIGWQGPVIGWLRELRVLPESFLFGYAYSYAGSLSRGAFLAGEYSSTGWTAFFPLAFVWKSTLPEIVGVAVLVTLGALRILRSRVWVGRLAPLVALTLVYGIVALTSNLNIGQRHLLPLYPGLFIAVGVVIARMRPARLLAPVVIGWQAATAAWIFPFYLAYFNPLAGGPPNGWRLLVDSSLDWGQDLGGLARWLERNNAGLRAQPVFLSYFGSGEPAYYGLNVTRMFFVNGFKLPLRWYEPTGGIYAISATMLQGVYNSVQGPWTLEHEREYHQLRAFEAQYREIDRDPSAAQRFAHVAAPDRWSNAWRRYERLRHARLCAYLRARGPDDSIGHSILVFRLTDAELEPVLRGPFSEWKAAVEAALSRNR